ncbi:MAG: hypothetical protein KL863_28520 [Rhizobium sp.]|nr:hypothetical protein [Rhizobium sp.]
MALARRDFIELGFGLVPAGHEGTRANHSETQCRNCLAALAVLIATTRKGPCRMPGRPEAICPALAREFCGLELHCHETPLMRFTDITDRKFYQLG